MEMLMLKDDKSASLNMLLRLRRSNVHRLLT